MNINYELYKVFYYVARYLNFSKASNHLYISQSAVSQSIKQLEEKLGVKLFFRHTKKVKLTSEGKILFEHIEQAFNFINQGENSLKEMKSLNQGEISIGASDTICKYYLLPYIKKFHELYPDIKLNITNKPSPICIELLEKGQVDISIVNLPNKVVNQKLNVYKVKTIQDVFIAGKKYIHLTNDKISIKEFEKYPFLSLERNSTTRMYFELLCKKHSIRIKPEIELDSIDLLIELTKIGLGLSFVMFDAVKRELKDKEIFIIKTQEKIPTRDIGILSHKQIPVSIATQKFMNIILNNKAKY